MNKSQEPNTYFHAWWLRPQHYQPKNLIELLKHYIAVFWHTFECGCEIISYIVKLNQHFAKYLRKDTFLLQMAVKQTDFCSSGIHFLTLWCTLDLEQ